MPFVDATRSLIKQSIEIARASTFDDRVKTAFMFEDYLTGNQLEHIPTLLGAQGVKYDQMPKLTFPFCDRVIGELSLTYKRPPVRYFDSVKPTRANGGIWKKSQHDELVGQWHDLAEQDEADYNPTFVTLDKRTRMHGRTIVRVWPAFDLDSAEHKAGLNYPRFDVFHPGQYDVIVDPMRPARPLAIILFLSTADSGVGDKVEQVWFPDESFEVVNGVEQAHVPNKLAALPFVSFANYIDPQEYWREGLGLKLCRNNAVFDLGWTHLFSMAIQQAHGQPVAKNADNKWKKNPIWGWDKLVQLDDDGEFSFANANADIPGMISVLEKLIERTYFICGLPTNRFKDDSAPESGVAYRVKNASVLEDREERASLFMPRERALWRLAFRVARVFGLTTLPDPKSIIIDYAAPEIPVPQVEAQAERDWNLKAGLTSMVDLYREQNPGTMSDDEAIEELRRNAAINAEFMGVKAAPTLRDLVTKSKVEGLGKDRLDGDEEQGAGDAEDVDDEGDED